MALASIHISIKAIDDVPCRNVVRISADIADFAAGIYPGMVSSRAVVGASPYLGASSLSSREFRNRCSLNKYQLRLARNLSSPPSQPAQTRINCSFSRTLVTQFSKYANPPLVDSHGGYILVTIGPRGDSPVVPMRQMINC